MWDLIIKTPDGSTQKAAFNPAAPGGVAGGFRWTSAPDGSGLQLVFGGRPDLLGIEPRDIVQLKVDGQPAFYGYAAQTWPASDRGNREYRVLGAKELLRQRVYDGRSYSTRDVAEIVRDIAQRLLPPAIAYDPALVPDTGQTLSLRGGVGASLARVFDDLAKSVTPPRVWGVDAEGRFFWVEPSGVMAPDLEAAERRPIPYDGTEVVTAAVVLVGGAIPVRYEAPEHAIYGAEKAWVYPMTSGQRVSSAEMHGIEEETTDGGATWVPWKSGAQYFLDGDPNTGVRLSTSGGDIQIYYDPPQKVDKVYIHVDSSMTPAGAVVWWVLEDGTVETASGPDTPGVFQGWITIGKTIKKLGIQPNYLYQPL